MYVQHVQYVYAVGQYVRYVNYVFTVLQYAQYVHMSHNYCKPLIKKKKQWHSLVVSILPNSLLHLPPAVRAVSMVHS